MMYLTKAQKLNLKYAGLDLGDETEKKLEIIMEDSHTKKEAVDYLCNGSAVYEKEEFVKFFNQYMDEWDVEEEDREEYKNKVNDNKGGTRMNVKNQYGKEVNFDEALKLMDADLRENVAYELSLSSDQEFFNKYAEAHKEKFGVTWGPDQEK